MTPTIFISFASQDRKVALTLCSVLESRGFNCWISARDIQPGENFQVAIVQAIRRAKILLLVFTGNSNNSQEMTKELALASQNKLMVVPLRIEDVTPNDAFAYEFATRQWIDFFADWEFAIDQLCRRIAYAIGPDHAPPVADLPADAPVTLPIGPKPAAPAAAEPPTIDPVAAESAPPPKPVKAAKAPKPPEPVAAAANDRAADTPEPVPELDGAPKRRSGLGLGLAAGIALILIGLGVASPMLLKSKSAAKPGAPPAVAAAAAPAVAEPIPRAAVALSAPPRPAEAETATAADQNVTGEAPLVQAPVVKRKASKPNRHAESKLPY